MTKKQLTFIGTIIILAQLALFRNYLPFLSQKLIVKGIRCTCPDAEIISGKSYLKSITPDSLKKYDLDYSEIYFEEEISTSSDPMGVHQYIITGKVIGKESISEGDGHYYPLFKIENYSDAFLHNILKWIIRGLLIFEVVALYRMIKRKTKKQ
jgi:hypothetical protein